MIRPENSPEYSQRKFSGKTREKLGRRSLTVYAGGPKVPGDWL